MLIRMSARTRNENTEPFLRKAFSSLESHTKFSFLSMSLGLKWSDEAFPTRDALGQTGPETGRRAACRLRATMKALYGVSAFVLPLTQGTERNCHG